VERTTGSNPAASLTKERGASLYGVLGRVSQKLLKGRVVSGEGNGRHPVPLL